MDKVVFSTPGIIPIRAFTSFGISAKPETKSPIGYFGTGLKYAVAILLRSGCKITMYRGKHKYVFEPKAMEFRDKQFTTIMLQRHSLMLPRIFATELPFTTELGKNWELWQAFRELYSNTLDENGSAVTMSNEANYLTGFQSEWTHIIVEGDKFLDEYHDRAKTFLPEALRERPADGTSVQRFDGVSKHIYYRGMRVHDLKEPSLFTYNILSTLELTEDRTVKHAFYIDSFVASYWKASTDKELVKRVVTAKEGVYERKLDFDYSYGTPNEVFLDVAVSEKAHLSPTISKMVSTYRPDPVVKTTYPFDERLSRIIECYKGGQFARAEELIEQDRDEWVLFLQEAEQAKYEDVPPPSSGLEVHLIRKYSPEDVAPQRASPSEEVAEEVAPSEGLDSSEEIPF